MALVKKKQTWVDIHPGCVLRGLRELHGLTQSELSRMSGIGPNAISAIEAGHRGVGKKSAVRLSACLKVPPGVFICPDGWVKFIKDRLGKQ